MTLEIKYIYVNLAVYRGDKKIKTVYSRPLRISPNGLPAVVYNRRVYEITNGSINIDEHSFNKNMCQVFFMEDDYKEARKGNYPQLLQALNKVEKYEILFSFEVQKLADDSNSILERKRDISKIISKLKSKKKIDTNIKSREQRNTDEKLEKKDKTKTTLLRLSGKFKRT